MFAPGAMRILFLVLVTALALSGGMLAARYGQAPVRADIDGLLWPNPKRLAPFSLAASDGQVFDTARLSGRWTFLFFGYTYCPDICPTTLASMASAMQALRRSGGNDDVQMVFVSVDPARDSLERLKDYVSYFDPDLLAATSAQEDALQRFTRDLGVLYVRHEPDQDGRYDVDHTASVLLVDPRGRMVGVFSAPHRAQQIASRFNRIRAFVEDAS